MFFEIKHSSHRSNLSPLPPPSLFFPFFLSFFINKSYIYYFFFKIFLSIFYLFSLLSLLFRLLYPSFSVPQALSRKILTPISWQSSHHEAPLNLSSPLRSAGHCCNCYEQCHPKRNDQSSPCVCFFSFQQYTPWRILQFSARINNQWWNKPRW